MNEDEEKKEEVAPPAEAPAEEPEDERPLFARSFPKTPEVDALLLAFERGNYARVREEAPALASKTDNPDVKRAAEELFRRIQPDIVSKSLLAVAAVLLAFFVYWYLGQHNHPEVPQ